MKILSIITYSLVIIGALNWGLVGMFGFDLVAFLFGEMSAISRVVYSLVGVSALASVAIRISDCMSEKDNCCLSSS
jgi:hypothetical protein